MPTMEATSSPLSPQPKISLEEEMQHMVDPELPPKYPSDRMAPKSNLDPGHQEKVLRVIRWAMNESIAKHVDQKTGAVDATRYDILEDAHRHVINKLRENPAIPNSSINLIYRDADHYLVARRGMSDFVKYPTNPELRASLTPFVFMFYDVTKGLGHAAEAITGERWTPLRSNRDFPAAQPGGAEWALLGVRHFLKWDKSRMDKKEIPELPEETAAERLFKAIEDAYGTEATGVDQTATNMDEKRASLRRKK
jgi:hypothetical protein